MGMNQLGYHLKKLPPIFITILVMGSFDVMSQWCHLSFRLKHHLTMNSVELCSMQCICMCDWCAIWLTPQQASTRLRNDWLHAKAATRTDKALTTCNCSQQTIQIKSWWLQLWNKSGCQLASASAAVLMAVEFNTHQAGQDSTKLEK